ncbi:MAG TPA: biotin/lipoyl-containing protein [Candidatus Limnocylindrales bacterium]|nr:biotin/lipoyl-containing protein [Candidatus Limnocylindrales bacterium]
MAEMSPARPAYRVDSSPSTAMPDDGSIVVGPDAAIDGSAVVHVGAIGPVEPSGRRAVEVVVDGWRFELHVEDEGRAALRDRATRDRDAAVKPGESLEIRAIIPGRVASVAVAVGDTVETGQTLLAVEAMKMQNELRAPRAGTVLRVPAAAGATVELGDVLVVLE